MSPAIQGSVGTPANSDQKKEEKVPCAMFIDVVSAITRHWITIMTIKVPTSLCFIIVFKIRMSVLNTIIQNCNNHTVTCDISSPYWSHIDVKSPWSYGLSCGILIRQCYSRCLNTLLKYLSVTYNSALN